MSRDDVLCLSIRIEMGHIGDAGSGDVKCWFEDALLLLIY